jgi:hypothetical protein
MAISHYVWRNFNPNKQKLENVNNRGVHANHFRNFFCGRPQKKITWSIDFPNRFVETDALGTSVSTFTANEVIHVADVKSYVVIHLTNVNSYTYQLGHL